MHCQVAYVVNNAPRYMEMAKTSIHLLRQHNRTVPVTVFLVEQPQHRRPRDFYDFCEEWEVDLQRRRDVGTGYFQDNKVHLAGCTGDLVLALDADTFVFADVDELFNAYAGFDLVACANDWVWHLDYRADLIPGGPLPLNSGVALCSSEFLAAWTTAMPSLHEALRTGTGNPSLTDWLYRASATAYNREEFGMTICSARADFRTDCFDERDCKLLKYRRLDRDLADFRACTRIFHSYSQHWRRCLRHL
jgi:hypothetical protein